MNDLDKIIKEYVDGRDKAIIESFKIDSIKPMDDFMKNYGDKKTAYKWRKASLDVKWLATCKMVYGITTEEVVKYTDKAKVKEEEIKKRYAGGKADDKYFFDRIVAKYPSIKVIQIWKQPNRFNKALIIEYLHFMYKSKHYLLSTTSFGGKRTFVFSEQTITKEKEITHETMLYVGKDYQAIIRILNRMVKKSNVKKS